MWIEVDYSKRFAKASSMYSKSVIKPVVFADFAKDFSTYFLDVEHLASKLEFLRGEISNIPDHVKIFLHETKIRCS